MAGIKAVLFDLGNVLVRVNKEIALQEFSRLTGFSGIQLLSFLESEIEKDFELGLISTHEYIKRVEEFFGSSVKLDVEMLSSIWSRCFKPDEVVLSIVDRLDGRVTRGILSNTNSLHIDSIRKNWRIFDSFDYLFFSYEIGYAKPDKRIYQFAVEKLEVVPEQVIFIDDLEENVSSAEEFGLVTHLFENWEKLYNFLRGYGVIY